MLVKYYRANKERFSQHDHCPLILYLNKNKVVELIGNVGEEEMDFLDRMEQDHPALADADEIFLQVIGLTGHHQK